MQTKNCIPSLTPIQPSRAFVLPVPLLNIPPYTSKPSNPRNKQIEPDSTTDPDQGWPFGDIPTISDQGVGREAEMGYIAEQQRPK